MFDDGVRYELKTVKAVRGLEARSVSKWHKEGWELVDQSAGTLHTTLEFRRRKPPLPVRQIVLGGAAALVLAGVIGVGALLEGDGDGKTSPSADATPVATEQPTGTPTPVATEQPASTPTPAATGQPVDASTPITDTTVNALLDRLNAGDMGGIANGDRFRFTGELIWSDVWGTGVTGEFSVHLNAKDGTDDLMVFVDESAAAGWQDGTRVEMVVESGERTINGETWGGWLLARSVQVVPGS